MVFKGIHCDISHLCVLFTCDSTFYDISTNCDNLLNFCR